MVDLDTMSFSRDKAGVKPNTQHILVVDDEEAIADLVRSFLESSGYRVTTYSDGEEALASLGSNPGSFDLVITDYNMPKKTGIQLAAEISKLKSEIPIILMSGDSYFLLKEDVAALGFKGCIAKPFGPADFVDAVRKVLAGGYYF